MALRYVAFAIVATVTNIAVQEIAIHTSPVSPLAVSILAGTIAGFAVKYVLDKLYVFADAYQDRASEARKVALYGAFSVLTTIIFWGCELAAWTLYETSLAKYTGAVIGLAIGYAAKFALDRKYVFVSGAGRVDRSDPGLDPELFTKPNNSDLRTMLGLLRSAGASLRSTQPTADRTPRSAP
jgi:putative flippase GtrA